MTKNILVVAKNNKVEALRVAIGLVLLSDIVKVVVIGELDDTQAIASQREVMEFADVSCELLPDTADQSIRLATEMASADAVYVI